MFIYILCPVTKATPEQIELLERHTKELESEGHTVHLPHRDVEQDPSRDSVGYTICALHREAMEEADRVDILWDYTSNGSHFDLGMAFALRKPLYLIDVAHPDWGGRSFLKVIQTLVEAQRNGEDPKLLFDDLKNS